MRRCASVGLLIWLAGTLILRFAGQYFLFPENVLAIALLLLVSFPLMAFVARRVCSDASIPPDQWPVAAIFLVTPSLVLDTFSSAFFPLVYPNMPAQAAGLFGGWILWCCAGALLGVNFARR
jgi:hypothetical protein